MVELAQQYWWVFLILWVVSKVSRHVETSGKKKQESNTSDAENLVLNMARSLDKNVGNKSVLDKVLNDASEGLGDGNVYKRALVDGVVSQLEKDEEKRFTPIKGSHPLSQLADRAVKAETKREKIKRGLKQGAVIGLKILRGGLT